MQIDNKQLMALPTTVNDTHTRTGLQMNNDCLSPVGNDVHSSTTVGVWAGECRLSAVIVGHAALTTYTMIIMTLFMTSNHSTIMTTHDVFDFTPWFVFYII